MTGTVLIVSGAYVEPELQAEFGRLPPAFLPLGNRRLFVHQHAALLSLGHRILMTLPDDFTPDPTDTDLLNEMGIGIVPVPATLELGQSLVYAINVTRSSGAAIKILHGDTLFLNADLSGEDSISVASEPPPDYAWGGALEADDGRLSIHPAPVAGTHGSHLAITGFFALSDAALLVQAITRAGGDFLAGLAGYASSRPLKRFPQPGEWLDFGHAGTYHRSRRRVTTEREFNRLVSRRRAVVKSSTKSEKILAEAAWFERLPQHLRLYSPAYLGRGANPPSYALEYKHLPTLTDLFVFGRLPTAAWARIFNACDEFLSLCHAETGTANDNADLYKTKTLARLEDFARDSGMNLDAPCRLNGAWLPSLNAMVHMVSERISPASQVTLVHGDFCFSNILYDVRADLIQVIDPRGFDADGKETSYGDLRYDIGKLHHSVVGRYDHIVAGYYRLRRFSLTDFDLQLPASPVLKEVETMFMSHDFAGARPVEHAGPEIAVLLFLSMLPLHRDDPKRQQAFLANALRLFLALERRSADVA